jgi:hypothetical protein
MVKPFRESKTIINASFSDLIRLSVSSNSKAKIMKKGENTSIKKGGKKKP